VKGDWRIFIFIYFYSQKVPQYVHNSFHQGKACLLCQIMRNTSFTESNSLQDSLNQLCNVYTQYEDITKMFRHEYVENISYSRALHPLPSKFPYVYKKGEQRKDDRWFPLLAPLSISWVVYPFRYPLTPTSNFCCWLPAPHRILTIRRDETSLDGSGDMDMVVKCPVHSCSKVKGTVTPV